MCPALVLLAVVVADSVGMATSAPSAPPAAPPHCAGQGSPDWRNVCNGRLISATGGYQDQPQILVRADGGWSCVFTLGGSHEGGGSQRVVSTVSTNEGITLDDSAGLLSPSLCVPGGRHVHG